MSRFLSLVLSLLSCVHSAANADDKSSFRIVGYLPDYRAAEFDPDAATALTDLIVFSAQPAKNGKLDVSRLDRIPWAKLREFKTLHRVRLVLCLGGWERSGNFAGIATDDVKRHAFVAEVVRFCLGQRLDGVDLDWEHPENEREQNAYATLLGDLRTAFEPHGLVLSVTMAAWQKLPQSGFDAVHWINVMSYDHDGRHSTFEGAQRDVKSLIDAGVPVEKITLGLPFYGRSIEPRDRTLTYREIVEKYSPAAEVDEVDGVYFNGPATIARKTQYALDNNLGGVMFWELGQDAVGEKSLLRVIDATANASGDR